ncbi:proline-specific peptidase [Hypoxylon sp. FL1150]|nr:proline-specific peptidase [Hypoxylon sp. FL1150]
MAGVQLSSTWYKVYGNLEDSSIPPLITLRSGPGAGHEYLSPLTKLYEKHGIPIIEVLGDDSFWTFDLFLEELDNLVDHLTLREKGFSIIVQTWGGMLRAIYAARCPEGLKKLIISSSLASIPLYIVGNNRLRSELPLKYKEASALFYKRHVCCLDPLPDDVQAAFTNLDHTAHLTVQEPFELVITGSTKDWEGWEVAHQIGVDTLVLNGRYDEMTEICVEPWFRVVPRVKWVTFENSSHLTHREEPKRFLEVCGSFLPG